MACAAIGLGLWAGGSLAQSDCADLALVLAIDASGSVDAVEFGLQQQGYARAFQSHRVQAALAAAGVVDVAVTVWGDSELAPQVLPMARLRDGGDAVALAGRITAMPRQVTGNTGMGKGVDMAVNLLRAPGVCAHRRVINVSGDGMATMAPRRVGYVSLEAARARAAAEGITINGLAIVTNDRNLTDWYRQNVMSGAGAFVMQADGFADFAQAIEAKLVREIAPLAVSWVAP